MLTKETSIKKSPNAIESEIDGDVVLMNIDNNEYYSMDNIGSSIWKMLDEPIRIAEIIDQLLEKYDVSPETCEKDTMKFLNQLLEKQIIAIDD